MGIKSLTSYSDADCTTPKSIFNYSNHIYFNADFAASEATTNSVITIKTYDVATNTLIQTLTNTTYSFLKNTVTSLKNTILSGTASTDQLLHAEYPGGKYYAELYIEGSDTDPIYGRAYFSVVDAPRLTSPTISETSIYQDQSVTFTASVTDETNSAWVVFLDGTGKEVYNKEMTITGTAATCRTDPLKIPVAVYAAGQIRIYARNDEDAVIDITSAVYDATLALTVLVSPAMPSGLLNYLNQEATLEAALTKDEYGQHSYDTAVTVACRIAQKVQKIINSQGKEVISHSMVYLNGSQTVTVNDRITLPDGTTPEILQIGSTAKANGIIIMKVVYT